NCYSEPESRGERLKQDAHGSPSIRIIRAKGVVTIDPSVDGCRQPIIFAYPAVLSIWPARVMLPWSKYRSPNPWRAFFASLLSRLLKKHWEPVIPSVARNLSC